MIELAVIAGSVGVFVAGFVAWYTLWHRRLAASFERVPVRTGVDPTRHDRGLQ
jgi:hypothetical protein